MCEDEVEMCDGCGRPEGPYTCPCITEKEGDN